MLARHSGALTARLTLAFVAALALAGVFVWQSAAAGPAPAERAPVSLAPASLPPVSLSGGAFTLWVSINDLEHHGQIGYDQNRDTVPDRFVPSVGFGGFELTFQYDQTRLRVQGVQSGNLAGDTGRFFQCLQREDEPGSLSFGCASTGEDAGRQGSFTLAEVSFMPVGQGTSVVQLAEVEASGPLGDDIPVERVNSSSVVDIGTTSGPPDDDDLKNPPGNGNPGGNNTDDPGNSANPGDGPGPSGDDPNTSNQPGNGDPNGDPPNAGPGDEVSNPVDGDPPLDDGGSQLTSGGPDGDKTGDQEGAGAQSSSDGGGGLGIALWSALAAAGAVVAGGLGIAAFRWRQVHSGD